MTKKLLTLIAAAAATLSVSACYQDTTRPLPEGRYERSTSSTDEYGTKTQRKTVTDVDVDSEGNRRTVVEQKTTRDPKGLLNKETTSSKKVIEEERRY
jgi:hypothetical protein